LKTGVSGLEGPYFGQRTGISALETSYLWSGAGYLWRREPLLATKNLGLSSGVPYLWREAGYLPREAPVLWAEDLVLYPEGPLLQGLALGLEISADRLGRR
jgi:hypothetical protein